MLHAMLFGSLSHPPWMGGANCRGGLDPWCGWGITRLCNFVFVLQNYEQCDINILYLLHAYKDVYVLLYHVTMLETIASRHISE